MGQPDTHGHRQLLSVGEHETAGLNIQDDLLGAVPKSGDRAPGQQQGHLVTAETTHDVVAARGTDEQVGEQNEHLVAGRMSVAVVDRLELVDVQNDQRRPFAAGRSGKG